MKSCSLIVLAVLVGWLASGCRKDNAVVAGRTVGGDARKALVGIRKGGDTNAYLVAASTYLATNRDDEVAVDVMTCYARLRREAEFRAQGIAYATNSPSRLLEVTDIANNETWGTMTAEFARRVAQSPGASFAELFRAVRFLADNGSDEGMEGFLERLASMAVKRYQKEDVDLLRGGLAIRRGTADDETARTLSRLALDGMMPQVRREAARLQTELQNKEKRQ